MAILKMKPLGDRLLILPKEQETTTTGGIVIPASADKEKPIQGKVIAVGSGKYVNGKLYPLAVNVGDHILFGQYTGTSIRLDNVDYLVIREDDVLGIFE